MFSDVKFSQTTTFLGRNGNFKCTGLMLDTWAGTVIVSPITGKGDKGRCNIEIPLQDLPVVIAALQKFVPAAGKRLCMGDGSIICFRPSVIVGVMRRKYNCGTLRTTNY